MNTHNLCFGAKIRKNRIPLHTPVLLYKSGVQGVYITRICFRDANQWHDLYVADKTNSIKLH